MSKECALDTHRFWISSFCPFQGRNLSARCPVWWSWHCWVLERPGVWDLFGTGGSTPLCRQTSVCWRSHRATFHLLKKNLGQILQLREQKSKQVISLMLGHRWAFSPELLGVSWGENHPCVSRFFRFWGLLFFGKIWQISNLHSYSW